MDNMALGTSPPLKSLYEAARKENEGQPALTCEWTEEPKDAEEERKRKGIEAYIKYISSTEEFKNELRIRIDKEFDKALADGRI